MRVLITGGTGFIGSHCAHLLETRKIEHVTCGRSEHTGIPGHVQCDLHKLSEIDSLLERFRPTHLLHIAWSCGPDYSESSENLMWHENTRHLIQAFYAAGGRRFVGIGTCVEYTHTAEPRSEVYTPTQPDTLYGKCKLATALYLQAFAGTYSLSYAWCRLFYMTGPGENLRRLIPSALQKLICDEVFESKSINNTLDYMDVRDVAGALVTILTSGYCGIVNVGTGKGIRIKNLLNNIVQMTGTRAQIREYRNFSPPETIIADVRLLHNEIAFTPQYTLQKTLIDLYADMKERKWIQ